MLVHSVFFWLKQSISDEDRAFFTEKLQTLAEIDSTEQVYIGTPSKTEHRPVIDNSYDYALTVILKDIPAHDAYQEDPKHLAFIEACSNLWERVTVYDAD